MDKVKLPPRLARIASLVPQGARIADVGTDHGLLPVWLLETGAASAALATDIRPDPLSKAERLRAERGLSSMRCILCDGLEGVSAGEADTVIIAGMGGENIAGILQRATWTQKGVRLLLQPMSRPEALRAELCAMGIEIIAEHLVEDGGRIYSVLTAVGGVPHSLSETELYTGEYALVSGEPLFVPMVDGLISKLTSAVNGMEMAEEKDETRLGHLQRVLAGLEEMRGMHHA